MVKFKWLQVFAEGGEGAADAGESAADPGAARLRELGVPEDKIRKRAKTAEAPWAQSVAQTAVVEQPEETKQEQAAAADPKEGAKRMTWQEIMADPEYNREMQNTMKSRLKKSKEAEDALAGLLPALEMLAAQKGLDTKNLDYAALSQAIMDDDQLYEGRAIENGTTVAFEKELEQTRQREAAATSRLRQLQEQQDEAQRQQQFMEHMTKLRTQSEALKAKFPGFDLDTEMQNPDFQRLTHPAGGRLSVEAAYTAIHYAEIEKAIRDNATRQASEAMAANLQAKGRRPNENGASAQAPSTPKFDYSKASPAERAAFKRYLETEAAQGRKVYPR